MQSGDRDVRGQRRALTMEVRTADCQVAQEVEFNQSAITRKQLVFCSLQTHLPIFSYVVACQLHQGGLTIELIGVASETLNFQKWRNIRVAVGRDGTGSRRRAPSTNDVIKVKIFTSSMDRILKSHVWGAAKIRACFRCCVKLASGLTNICTDAKSRLWNRYSPATWKLRTPRLLPSQWTILTWKTDTRSTEDSPTD